MKNNKNRFINIQLFAEQEGSDTTTTQTDTQTIDYESEYKKILAERDSFKAEFEKQKGLKDKYASENAEYKRKETEKMTDDEKKAKEYADLVESSKKMQETIANYELKENLLNNGFTAEEVKIIMDSKCSPESYAKIMADREEKLKKTLNAEAIANLNNGSLLGVGSTNNSANQKSDFAKFQEEMQKKDTSGKVEF